MEGEEAGPELGVGRLCIVEARNASPRRVRTTISKLGRRLGSGASRFRHSACTPGGRAPAIASGSGGAPRWAPSASPSRRPPPSKGCTPARLRYNSSPNAKRLLVRSQGSPRAGSGGVQRPTGGNAGAAAPARLATSGWAISPVLSSSTHTVRGVSGPGNKETRSQYASAVASGSRWRQVSSNDQGSVDHAPRNVGWVDARSAARSLEGSTSNRATPWRPSAISRATTPSDPGGKDQRSRPSSRRSRSASPNADSV